MRKRKLKAGNQTSDLFGVQTFVSQKSQEAIPNDDEKNRDSVSWSVQQEKTREKERPLPAPTDFPKTRQRNISQPYFNKNDHVPIRTVSEPGDKEIPTKYDYNYPKRRSMTAAADNPGSTRFIKHPYQKQKNQKGESKQTSRQWYLANKARLKPLRRKYWIRKKRDPDTKRMKKYRKLYKSRFERKGKSRFNTPAERSKDWRDKKAEYYPVEMRMQYKKTESPSGSEFRSFRTPKVKEDSRGAHPPGIEVDRKVSPTRDNGSGKVVSNPGTVNKAQNPVFIDQDILFSNTKKWDG